MGCPALPVSPPSAPRGQPARDALLPLGDLVPRGDEPLRLGLSRDGARSCPRGGWGAAGGCEPRRGHESPGTAAAGKVPSKMPKRAPTSPGTHRSTAGPWELGGDKGGSRPRCRRTVPGARGGGCGVPVWGRERGLGERWLGSSPAPPRSLISGGTQTLRALPSLFGGAPRYVPLSPRALRWHGLEVLRVLGCPQTPLGGPGARPGAAGPAGRCQCPPSVCSREGRCRGPPCALPRLGFFLGGGGSGTLLLSGSSGLSPA